MGEAHEGDSKMQGACFDWCLQRFSAAEGTSASARWPPANLGTPSALAALSAAAASCMNCTFLNDVRISLSQEAAGKVFSHFSFIPTSVAGPSGSCSQQCLLTDVALMQDGREIGNAGPREA